ncbi:MAG: hypothetical protein IKU40_11025 [Clostridia bacterium]|nr:hypothetical protein [Clostridia bacterium]
MLWTILGIIIVFIGTTFSLWSIITNDIQKAGTWASLKDQGNEAKKEKVNVIIGIVLISIGSILQIIGAIFN